MDKAPNYQLGICHSILFMVDNYRIGTVVLSQGFTRNIYFFPRFPLIGIVAFMPIFQWQIYISHRCHIATSYNLSYIF